ncbi:DUF1778 domain-containing protein [Chryseobacterium suipulveris]|uniref:DUF1778 domain-containing protein n=1 Tax=Chryseobacterium suipulveris TaxID=2929800 RepID=A0ABY4BRJ7_9FLAO|nr:DUF1778 domain-containing protein [Chryseobacterium suipulveris]UOE41828.1 DUF1778 domain-containing protein [Chryseobacterium suipulveris]
MQTKTLNTKQARFDTRLSQEQKDAFEKASVLGGFRNFSDFVITAIQEKADKIFEENERILASEKDNELFFEAIFDSPKPNKNLSKALEDYKKAVS